jgi:hypothetical protein
MSRPIQFSSASRYLMRSFPTKYASCRPYQDTKSLPKTLQGAVRLRSSPCHTFVLHLLYTAEQECFLCPQRTKVRIIPAHLSNNITRQNKQTKSKRDKDAQRVCTEQAMTPYDSFVSATRITRKINTLSALHTRFLLLVESQTKYLPPL